MSGNVLFELAQSVVGEFAADSDALAQSRREAMRVLECEAVLARGIGTYELLKRADEMFREADRRGIFAYSEELQRAVDGLYQEWLATATLADKWLEHLDRMGELPTNWDQFCAARDEARALVEDRRWLALTQAAFDEAQAE